MKQQRLDPRSKLLRPEVRGWRLARRFLIAGAVLLTVGFVLGLVTTGGGL